MGKVTKQALVGETVQLTVDESALESLKLFTVPLSEVPRLTLDESTLENLKIFTAPKFDFSRVTLDIDESALQSLKLCTAPLSEVPRLVLGDDAFENIRHSSMGESAIEMMRGTGITDSIRGMGAWENDTAKSLLLASGVNLAWQDSPLLTSIRDAQQVSEQTAKIVSSSLALGMAENRQMIAPLGEAARQMLGENTRVNIADSIGTASPLWDSIRAAQRVSEQTLQSRLDFARDYAAEHDAISKRISMIRAEQRQQQESYSQWFAEISKGIAAEQQQRQEAMLAAFADIGRWQRPAILWPEMMPRQWEIYDPEPPAEQIEMVQADDQLTLESIDLALQQGRLSPVELEKLLQRYQREAAECLSPEIMFVAQLYKERGHRYDTQATFVMFLRDKKNFPISEATLKRMLKDYEAATGDRIRPGRGSRKRRSM